MTPSEKHVDRIRAQFTRQAEAYANMPVTRDEESMRRLVLLSGVGEDQRVLDVACGPGFLTLAFAEKCGEALGIDATDALLDLARAEAARRGTSNVAFRSGDATRLDLPDSSFDIVACRAAFHHFPEPERVLAEMVRVAKDGGRILVVDMLGSEDPEQAARRDALERLCDPTHVRSLPESEFLTLFRGAGLEVLYEPKVAVRHSVDEWLAHGGPSEEDAGEARRILEDSLEGDTLGVDARLEDGVLHFGYQGAAWLLRPGDLG